MEVACGFATLCAGCSAMKRRVRAPAFAVAWAAVTPSVHVVGDQAKP
jgi:hypothetical protein